MEITGASLIILWVLFAAVIAGVGFGVYRFVKVRKEISGGRSGPDAGPGPGA